MKKLLVIYGSYGSGHKLIAESIANYFAENSNEYEIKLLDVNKHANFSGKVSMKVFDFLFVHHRSELAFNISYELVDNKLAARGQIPFVKRSFDNEAFRKEITDFDPDITISTHYFGGTILSYYNKIGLSHTKILTVLTDYAYHRFWRVYHQYIDAYVVANEIVKNEMVDDGILAKKIYPVGLPFNQNKLLNIKSVEDIRKQYNLDPNKKTFVFFGGGSAGSMAYYKYFKSLVKPEYPINLVFISGRNKELETKARRYALKYKKNNIKVTGFIKDVYSLLNVADFVISKPGGSTVTECLIMKTPMICIPGVGGQEKYNARFMVRKKYGLKVRGTHRLNQAIFRVINNPELEKRFKTNMSKIKENTALEKILEITNRLTK